MFYCGLGLQFVSVLDLSVTSPSAALVIPVDITEMSRNDGYIIPQVGIDSMWRVYTPRGSIACMGYIAV